MPKQITKLCAKKSPKVQNSVKKTYIIVLVCTFGNYLHTQRASVSPVCKFVFFLQRHDLLGGVLNFDFRVWKHNRSLAILVISLQDTVKTLIRQSYLILQHHHCNSGHVQSFTAISSHSAIQAIYSYFQICPAISIHIRQFQPFPCISRHFLIFLAISSQYSNI